MHSHNIFFRLSILSALGLAACSSRAVGADDDGSPTPIDPVLCEGAEPIMQLGTDIPSGFVRCDDGFIHRPDAVDCEMPAAVGSCEFPDPNYGCQSDADCVDGPHGFCGDDNFGGGGCYCSYGCESDADCGEGTICACAGVVGSTSHCILADCPLTEACDDGLCGLDTWTDICGYENATLGCTTAASTCRTDDACGIVCDAEQLQLQCAASLGWNCQVEADVWCGEYCGEGRPFFIDGEARTARICAREDWAADSSDADDSLLSPAVRAGLTAYWSQVGLFEHASVASFARFAMQLMALGAPPKLLAATRRAAVDEVEHARLAFGLASRFAGRPLGPDGLTMVGALQDVSDPRAIVHSLIHEACVGETLAAIEARVAASATSDAQVGAVLDEIATDELRHAELGWSTLRWILDGADPSLRHFALTTLDEAIVAAVTGAPGPNDLDELELDGYGVLSSARRGRVRADAIREVLRPCAASLREWALGERVVRAAS